MAIHNKKALSGLVSFKTKQNNTEKHKIEKMFGGGRVGRGRGIVGTGKRTCWTRERFSYQIRHQENTVDSHKENVGPPCLISKIFTSPE